jgi:hypothetical protein
VVEARGDAVGLGHSARSLRGIVNDVRRHLRATGLVLAASMMLVLGGDARPGDAAPTRGPLPVTGYAGDWSAPSVVEREAGALSSVGVDGVDLRASGASVVPPSARALALLAVAHAHRLRADLLVANFDARAGTMSPTLAARLLQSAPHRARVVAQLARLVRVQGWDGITVDLESLTFADGPGLFWFVRGLRNALPRVDEVAVDVSAVARPADYPALGYRLTSLSREALVVLMAYDEDGPWSPPGPIGGLPWQRAAIAVARSYVAPGRLVLGVGTYGFAWPKVGGGHGVATVADAQARRLVAAAGRRPRWVAAQGEYTATLRDGTVLWWSDGRSFERRVGLVRTLHLAGSPSGSSGPPTRCRVVEPTRTVAGPTLTTRRARRAPRRRRGGQSGSLPRRRRGRRLPSRCRPSARARVAREGGAHGS